MADPTAHPPYDLERWRRRIPLLESVIPMNNCSQAPQSDVTRAAAHAFLAMWDRRGMDWEAWLGEVGRAREQFARLINAPAHAVAVCGSVSQAASSVASALDFTGARPTVVVTDAEFPTIGHVWLAQERAGAVVRWLPVLDAIDSLERYAEAVDAHTLLVSACHGGYQTGLKQDIAGIARIAHDRGALVFVDAYQTLGTEPVDVEAMDADFLASGTLKFLMGTAGIAFLYVRPSVLERLHPRVTGWFGRHDPFAFDARLLDWAPGAARMETGTPPILDAYIARAGMALIAEVGPERIGQWTRVLSRRLIDGGLARGLELVSPRDPERKTPTTAFVCPGDAHAIEARMRTQGVLPSARGRMIRLAPHFYSSLADVDRALDVLATEIARDAGRRA